MVNTYLELKTLKTQWKRLNKLILFGKNCQIDALSDRIFSLAVRKLTFILA